MLLHHYQGQQYSIRTIQGGVKVSTGKKKHGMQVVVGLAATLKPDQKC